MYHISEPRVQLLVADRLHTHKHCLLLIILDIGAFSSRSYVVILHASIISRQHDMYVVSNLFPERVSYIIILLYDLCDNILANISSPARRVLLLQ